MGDAERDESPTTPPKAIRPGGPVSGLRSEPEPSVPVDVSTTELSITEPSARDPNTLMSLPKPEPSDSSSGANVRALEDRLDALELRVRELENRRDPLGQARATPWWFWALFLFGLAATWRLLDAFK
jgi:hypothetical protein